MPHRFLAIPALVLLAACATESAAVEDDEGNGVATTDRPIKAAKKKPIAAAAEPEPAIPPQPTEPAEPAKNEPRGIVPAEPETPRSTTSDPFGDVGFKEVNEKDWLANIREKIAQQEKVPPTDLRLSPGLLRATYIRSPPVVEPRPGRRAPPRRHEIVVVDNQGRRVATFRAVAAKHGDEAPKDLRFLSEERLVYEVIEPPPSPETPAAPLKVAATAKGKARPAVGKKTKPARAGPAAAPTPAPPTRTFVIQPITPRARPIRCEGLHFAFSRGKDRLAFVAGKAEAAFVSVDGAQVYPRRGRTIVASAPAWSKDGRSLAFLEAPAAGPSRLVLLAELDNPTGDTTWDLPPAAPLEGALVFWAGSGKLVVGKTPTRPVFAASFVKETPSGR